MPEDIDYKALYEQVAAELGEARLTILKLRYVRSPLDALSAEKIRTFVRDNYLILLLGIMIFEVVFKIVMQLATKRKGATHGRAS